MFKKNKYKIIAWTYYLVGCFMLVYVTDTVIEYMFALMAMCLMDYGNKLLIMENN